MARKTVAGKVTRAYHRLMAQRERHLESVRAIDAACQQMGIHIDDQQLTASTAPQAEADQGGSDPIAAIAASELLDSLSRTERAVLEHHRQGQTEGQVAQRLQRSPHTVHVHVKNIYRKFRVSSRRELIALLVAM